MIVNLAAPIRAALLAASSVTSLLTSFQGTYPIFTRRPVPTGSPMPLLVVSPDISLTDEDGVNDDRPVIVRDVSIYGRNDSDPDYRLVESISYAVRDLFHRNRASITVSGWNVTDLLASGPIAAPVDDEQTVGRLVSLTVRLSRMRG